jgi:hypothetical protein
MGPDVDLNDVIRKVLVTENYLIRNDDNNLESWEYRSSDVIGE